MDKSLEKYIAYTELLKQKLDLYFSDQKEFLKCKAGCDLCCRNSYYPISELEYKLMKLGIEKLFSEEQKQALNNKAIELLKERRAFLKTNPDIMQFKYDCPFLINGACGIYNYRALLCRSHGLIFKDFENPNKMNAPHCMTLGLNYADVYDKETKQLKKEAFLDKSAKSYPKAYDLSYSFMLKEANADGDVDFGDIRMLFEWILMDIPNFEELMAQKD